MHVKYRSAIIVLENKDELKQALQAISELDQLDAVGQKSRTQVRDRGQVAVDSSDEKHVEPGSSLRGKTIAECATAILIERQNEQTHSRDIARIAISRGYKGRSGDEKKVARSFEQTIRRLPEFEAVGGGKFVLVNGPVAFGQQLPAEPI